MASGMYFVGTYDRTLDEKWRLPVPKDLLPKAARDEEQTNFYFAKGPAGCLLLFTEETFEEMTEQLLGRNLVKAEKTRRKLFGRTYAKLQDKNGRVQIPVKLREKAGFGPGDPLTLIGTGKYAEIWHAERAPQDDDDADDGDLIGSLGEAIGE